VCVLPAVVVPNLKEKTVRVTVCSRVIFWFFFAKQKISTEEKQKNKLK
jgi:hypothetical protein